MTVSNWLNPKYYPRIDKIQEMADFFGINTSDLIENKTLSKVQPLHRPLIQSEREILEPYNQLDTDCQNKVVDYANDLLYNEKYFEEETVTYIGMSAAENGYKTLISLKLNKL